MYKLKDLLKFRRQYEVYDSCDTLPLYNFVKILTAKDLKFLIVKGNPPAQVLNIAWNKISDQYAVLSDDKKNKYILDCVIDIDYLRNKLIIIQSLASELAKGYDEDIVNLLREVEIMVFYNGDMMQCIQSIVNQTKIITIELQEREGEYAELNAQSDTQTTESEYYLLIADMGIFMKSIIDIRKVTVSEFAAMYTLYKKQ